MKKFIRELMVLSVIGVMSAGAFGQGKPRDEKRPPKPTGKVVSPDKNKKPPPPRNSNRPKPDNKKRP